MTLPTENMPILISASTFFSILLLFIGIYLYARQRANKAKLLEKVRQGEDKGEALYPGPSSSITTRKAQKGILNLFGSLGKRVKPDESGRYSGMRARFLKAGLRRGDIHYIFWGIKCFLTILLPVSFLVLRITKFAVMSYNLALVITMFLALLGFYLPEIWLRMRIARRKDRLAQGFADVLDLLVVCVEAGMGLDAAINRVAEEMRLSYEVWSDELKLFNLELRAGKLRRDALKNLAIRTDIEDVNSLATLLIQTDKFGTSLAQTLRVYSETFRTKRYQRAEEIAAKLPVKLVFPLVLFIFPTLFISILGPAGIRVYHALKNLLR